jgi:GDP-L-fucose synthase
MADACVFMMKQYSGESFLNVGTGYDMSILEMANRIATVIGWQGAFHLDPSMLDGTPRKVMDVSRLKALGWTATTGFEAGIKQAYEWFVKNIA